MCRLLGYCSRGRASAASLLTEQGLREFTALSAFHSDGWGMAWYRAGGPEVRKSMRRAADEPDYDQLAHRALGDIGMVHLRWATPGLGLSRQNCHPFRYGRYTLAHNGAIHPQSKLGEMLPAEWERQLHGTTDSERYFLHLMWRLERRGGDMAAAIADTQASIGSRYAVNSLNAILLSPDRMYAISWHDPARIPEAELRRRGLASTPAEAAGYFHLAYRATVDAVVVASSGWPQPGWTVLANQSVVVVERATLEMSEFSTGPAFSPALPALSAPGTTRGRRLTGVVSAHRPGRNRRGGGPGEAARCRCGLCP
jgi:predicted glutamine amidotransferase